MDSENRTLEIPDGMVVIAVRRGDTISSVNLPWKGLTREGYDDFYHNSVRPSLWAVVMQARILK